MENFAKTSDELLQRLLLFADSQKQKNGKISKMIGLTPVSCDIDTLTAVYTHTATKEEINVLGVMHGGIVTWLLDTSMGSLGAAYTFTGNPTANISVSFIRGIKPGDNLEITATLDHVGGHLVNTHAKITVDGTLCATATGTFFRIEK